MCVKDQCTDSLEPQRKCALSVKTPFFIKQNYMQVRLECFCVLLKMAAILYYDFAITGQNLLIPLST